MTSARIGLNLLALALGACAVTSCTSPDPPALTVTPPPSAGVADYQLGEAYAPDDRVRIVGRDRSAEPADGLYSICYVNGFQTQPGERKEWPEHLLLRTDAGEPVIDPGWPDEVILDTSTAAKRDAIADIVSAWIEGCAASGFQAVEFDNLDTFTRTGGALSLDDNLSLAAALVDVAHRAGLAAGQKNAAEYAAHLRGTAGFDFAVTEECAAYEECSDYAAVYGSAVIDIEYSDALPRTFAEMCRDPESPASMVLRDRQLTAPGDPDHVFAVC
ncbi:glycosyl hydrolase family 114 [Microbacterium sp. AG1240]|uniref:endo alpha-1,4 polygalactosaminidase n=1 Tax=Microbacterium sp. AG1240 TaxID=2183992 RepID=UPI000EAE63A9|nr:endo alpha-1,4 polygalactosaminidase [Microbacterium sp. AG1240]RKT36000.1 glycosyl hydrolase family 114 [Microbacterium sp. AG1240]